MKNHRIQKPAIRPLAAGVAAGMAFTACAAAVHASPTPAAGYKVIVFAAAPSGATAPDSIAVDNGHVFVGYGDKGGKTGGGTSTIAEFTTNGTLIKTITVAGHNDGLRADPATHLLWAMQNEDGNAQLAIIDPSSSAAPTVYALPSANGGGGYDDILFRGGKTYFSASNPAGDPNTGSAIVEAKLTNGTIALTPVFAGNAAATNALTGAATTLNLLDPDSLTVTPSGDLLLDSQGDNELVDISASTGAARVLPITVASVGKADDNLDDTVFAKSNLDALLVADRDSNIVYAVTGVKAGQAYSAANDDNLVGALNLATGVVTPIVTSLRQPHGMAILPHAPVAAAGYTIKPFASAPTGATSPDSIAVDRGHVFVGYGDKGGKTGGGTSTIAEFTTNGTLIKTFTVAGHNDGLKIDPATHLLWAMQNEDGNAQLAIIDPASSAAPAVYSLPSVNGGGGYDDILFNANKVYFSASNPAGDPNTGAAIVEATLTNGAFTLTPVLAGNAAAKNALTGAATTLNLLDPDSLTVTPSGDKLLDSQGDNELVDINASTNAVTVLPITVAAAPKADDNLDDTVFPTSGQDTLLIADRDSNMIYAVTGVKAYQAYSAANDDNLVGSLNMATGVVTPIVSHLQQPHGLAVIPFSHTFSAGLQMISAPKDYSGIALDGVFDLIAPKLATWDPTLAQYTLSPSAPADTLHIGKGYWARFSSPARLFSIDPNTLAFTSYSIPLSPGWNLIGNPFDQTMNVRDLSIKSGGTAVNLSQAADAGLVSPVLYSYAPDDPAYALHAYQRQTFATGVFAPYKGYWIRAFQSCDLVIGLTVNN